MIVAEIAEFRIRGVRTPQLRAAAELAAAMRRAGKEEQEIASAVMMAGGLLAVLADPVSMPDNPRDERRDYAWRGDAPAAEAERQRLNAMWRADHPDEEWDTLGWVPKGSRRDRVHAPRPVKGSPEASPSMQVTIAKISTAGPPCSACGAPIRMSWARFCTKCGAAVARPAVPVPAAPEPVLAAPVLRKRCRKCHYWTDTQGHLVSCKGGGT